MKIAIPRLKEVDARSGWQGLYKSQMQVGKCQGKRGAELGFIAEQRCVYFWMECLFFGGAGTDWPSCRKGVRRATLNLGLENGGSKI